MGMVIAPGSTILGHDAQDLARQIRAGRRRVGQDRCAGFRSDLLSPEALLVADAAGLVSGEGESRVLTARGRGLVARFGERLTLGQARGIISSVLARLETPEIVAMTGPLAVRIFGSVMRGEPSPGDIDMEVICAKVDAGWVPVSMMEAVFGHVPGWRDVMRDSVLTPPRPAWCDMLTIWRDGRALETPEPVTADPDAAARAQAEFDADPVEPPEIDMTDNAADVCSP